jgi:hypothetical protein
MERTAGSRRDYGRPGGTFASYVTARESALLAPLLPAPRPGGRLADDLPPAGGEHDLLPVADRLLVADAAAGLPGLFYDAAEVLLTRVSKWSWPKA